MDKEAVLDQMISDQMEEEIERMRASIFGQCSICSTDVTEWDISCGPYGGEFRGEECFHLVCLSGKIAVAG